MHNLHEGYINKNGIFVLQDGIVCPTGEILLVLRDGFTGKIKGVDHVKNMFVTTGKYALADALRGNVTNGRGQISYCEVGTNVQAPALADTGLLSPVARKLISARTIVNNVATFQTFFATTEGNGSLREAGLYGDGATLQLQSGTLFCRAAINRTKSTGDTLTLTWNVTIG